MNKSISGKLRISVSTITILGLLVPLLAQAAEQRGFVKSGETAIARAKVTLYQAAIKRSSRPRVLGSTTAEESGFFHITYTPPPTSTAVLYLIADGPRKHGKKGKGSFKRNPVRLAMVLGIAPFPPDVVINERTTVASAYSLAQFFVRSNLKGKSPGLPNAAMMVPNFVDFETGGLSPVLKASPNGNETSTLETFNTLANMVAACVNEMDVCPTFFGLTTTPRGHTPRNTLEALVNIVHNPWQNVRALAHLALVPPAPYQPALSPDSPPDAWTLALRFVGVPNTMSGPGNLAFDASGRLGHE